MIPALSPDRLAGAVALAFHHFRDMTPREFEKFRAIIREKGGISLSDGKKELLRARLGKVMRRRGIPSFREYLRIVEADDSGDEIFQLLDAVSTNLTSFFREGDHFRFLAEQALPQIVAARAARGERRIRGWSAGCSTGEEPYSIVMTLLDSLGPDAGWDARLLATDLSTRAVATARAGLYSREKVKGVPPAMVSRYFTREEAAEGAGAWRVGAPVRRIVTFGRLNLLEEYPFRGPFDFIFCRNVMIYFDRETQKMLIDRFCRYLAEGGFLFIGHSESLNGIRHPLQFLKPSVYRKPRATR